MFTTMTFSNIDNCCEHIKKILAEFESNQELEFQVIQSLTSVECVEDGGNWEYVGDVLYQYLKDLDDTKGLMIKEDDCWDFLNWGEDGIYKAKNDELYVNARDGLTVLCNEWAICENQFPIIVVKKTLYNRFKNQIIEMLKDDCRVDYTSKISPAVYVEIFYND